MHTQVKKVLQTTYLSQSCLRTGEGLGGVRPWTWSKELKEPGRDRRNVVSRNGRFGENKGEKLIERLINTEGENWERRQEAAESWV